MTEVARLTRVGRTRALGRNAFARASEEPYQRRPADAVVLVVAIGVVVATALHSTEPGSLDRALAQLAGEIPASLDGLLAALLRLGAIWAVGLVVVASFIARRGRLARDLLLAGGAAWLLGRGLAFLVDGASVSSAASSVASTQDSPSFPTVPIAVIAAVVAGAAPYLSRAMRAVGMLLVVLALPAAVIGGSAGPDDVVGGLALGLAVAALVHLALGSPGGRPTLPQIDLALNELGVDADDLRLAPIQGIGRTVVLGRTEGGPVDVTVIGRDERDARLLSKAFRFLVYRDSGPALFTSRLQEVEHEAYLLLRAERAGVAVPNLIEVGVAGPSAAVIATRRVDGVMLADADVARVDDATLEAVWTQVAALHAAGIAHGHLDASHVVLTATGPVLADFSAGSSGAPDSRLGADVASLLVGTAQIVGDDRAVAAACAGFGTETLGATLPYLQPGVLARSVRTSTHGLKAMMAELRERIATASGIEAPDIQELRRVSPGNIGMFALTAFGVWALLGVIGNPAELWSQIRTANFAWVLVAFGLWGLTNITYAISALGGLPPAADVPLGPLTMTQCAGSFLNLATPAGVGTMLMNIRFLQKRGIPAPTAIASGTLPGLGYSLIQIVVLLLTGSVVADQISLSDLGIKSGSGGGSHDVGLVGVVIVGLALLIGVIALVPKLRAKVIPPVVTTGRNVWSVLTSPRKLLLIIGGSLATQTINVLILSASLAAYGTHVSLAELLFVNTAVSLFASVIPVPGGMGVVEAGLTAGLTALGVDPSIATAAVMTDRLVTAYIPPIIGWVAMRWLQRRDFV